MSQANIPNITPAISITREDAISLLLASIAMEEIGLSHIINSEGENIQKVLNLIVDDPKEVALEKLITINSSVQSTMEAIIQKELLLQRKLSNVINMIDQ